ncbi:TetR/AcrR family transcriptional regulator [Frankia sp. CNm7]|uniref:TetR/AcrR family transcriptional regulator n=1 Tax=Frankia nepalensis TaxID=1836974 RepID=A0A937RH43_9ACTN|nr:TetR/AcrR family transcriptional regulator [Frankia nepalensis]MBL7499255.1 TetR/AcrR family transcriptional regulator [Frankia nepalensis]MBL7512030.1 TetR/AcrR family transcriptional regulator [Frankia nepalensis]MBL7519784.1 TetR/AcrR family transcriptional regulator [Frankia nepalensis]MBL7628759.1 TetR/AcrR family transcriptional regulator [Frankia nepalensis]
MARPRQAPRETPPASAPARRTRNDPRREQTPKKLMAAARVVFERDGFYNARLSDITAEANLAAGTLYNYYRSKHDLFHDVMKEVVAEITAIAPGHVSGQVDPVRRLEEVNRVYVQAFRRNARLLNLLYQARDDDQRLRDEWDQIASYFQDKVVAAIRSWQAAGLAYPDLDPLHTAHALTFMVERLVMAWSYDGVDYDEETLIDTVNKIWVRALGLSTGPHSPARPAPAAGTAAASP